MKTTEPQKDNRIERRGFLGKIFGAAAALTFAPGIAKAGEAVSEWKNIENVPEAGSLAPVASASMGIDAFISEILMVSFNFAPKGWAQCNGQTLPINQNQALFSLLGTNYGGNGQTTFQLPNLRGRSPINFGFGHTLGEAAGSTSTTINIQQMPAHTHLFGSSDKGISDSPVGLVPASNSAGLPQYGGTVDHGMKQPPADAAYQPVNVGGSQAHENMPPYTVINFIIALQGIFPSQS